MVAYVKYVVGVFICGAALHFFVVVSDHLGDSRVVNLTISRCVDEPVAVVT